MGGQNHQSTHCCRKYWTPTMERYFVDLMLEHIRSGNRIGHTFNKQAWTDMLTVFNSKFGSQYDKEVLKGRYTNLWKVFNDVKNLLGQNGFSWDANRKIVVADDYVWDSYIKIHPEAKPYRTKPLLNFDDLCLIYGYTVGDGRYSRSSHDVDVEDEIQGANFVADGRYSRSSHDVDVENEIQGAKLVADGRYSRSSHDVDVEDEIQGVKLGDCDNNVGTSTSSRIEWTPDMDQYFIELMLKQLERGNKLGSTFTKQAWTDMLAFFNARFSSEYNERVLRHRYRKLWKYYADLLALVKQEGFFWDEKKKMVVAGDDVWDSYIKAYPHVCSYRAKVFLSYDKLALIFGEMVGGKSKINCHQDKDVKSEALNENAGGSERSRTCWTPSMDRFLIDLMLQQVRSGNRIGQSFITQAWNEMAKSFNANFNSDHGKGVLKSRYKQFRKQYNDVRILIRQNGFTWDQGREMVMAEDHVWDTYIKAHPDARIYRIKTIPCYHKLCLIYGQEKFDGSYSPLVDSVEPPVGTSCAEIGDSKDEEPLAGPDASTNWTVPKESYFIDLMLEQVQQGNKIDSSFIQQAWVDMTRSFKAKFGAQYEQHVLENHYLNLMKQYIEISHLLNQQGFLWDEASQMIVSTHNHLWELYAKEHPEAISYRDKVVTHFRKLCNVFGTTEMVDRKLSCDHLRMMDLDGHSLDIKIEEYAGGEDILETKMYNEVKKRPPSTPLAIDLCCKSQKIREDPIPANTTRTGNNYFAIEKAIKALQSIPEIDDELLLDGCDLLEDERKARTFLALNETIRKKWLLRKLGR